MIEHLHWRGDSYESGIQGQRLAIVGYSHWGSDEGANADFTRTCVKRVMSGWKHNSTRFFTSIQNYFGFEDPVNFWEKVVFFNFLPNCIGDENDRFGLGTEAQNHRGQQRFLSILRAERPHKVFVFTTKGWRSCPETREEINSPDHAPLDFGIDFPGFSWGTYDVGGHIAAAFGLRHPQGADGELMRKVVQHILEVSV
jgi:hypothetical protein